jgi:hypothetical protein
MVIGTPIKAPGMPHRQAQKHGEHDGGGRWRSRRWRPVVQIIADDELDDHQADEDQRDDCQD